MTFYESIKDVFVDIHGDIDNIIEVDFLGSTRNLHIKRTSLPAC